MSDQFGHYFKDVSQLQKIDVYRVLLLFNVTDPAIAHAIKKLLCAGARGSKDAGKDVGEAIASLRRWQEMRDEDLGDAPLSETLGDSRYAALAKEMKEWGINFPSLDKMRSGLGGPLIPDGPPLDRNMQAAQQNRYGGGQ